MRAAGGSCAYLSLSRRTGAAGDEPTQQGGRRGLRRAGGTGGWGAVLCRARWAREIRRAGGADTSDPAGLDAPRQLLDQLLDSRAGGVGRSWLFRAWHGSSLRSLALRARPGRGLRGRWRLGLRGRRLVRRGGFRPRRLRRLRCRAFRAWPSGVRPGGGADQVGGEGSLRHVVGWSQRVQAHAHGVIAVDFSRSQADPAVLVLGSNTNTGSPMRVSTSRHISCTTRSSACSAWRAICWNETLAVLMSWLSR